MNRACYGMEWNGMAGKFQYGIVKVWNEMEDFINGMEIIVHTSIHFPYLFILMLFSYQM